MGNDLIYPAQRALERADQATAFAPARLYGVLLPMWEVEASATVRKEESFAVFDVFVSRAIAEAQLNRPSDIAAFLAVPDSLVDRALRYLHHIGHIEQRGEQWTPTALGQRSLADGVRYVEAEDRMRLWFDGLAGSPAPRGHYGVRLASDPVLRGKDRVEFTPFLHTGFDSAAAVRLLSARPDRVDFNLPEGLSRLTAGQTVQRWLPTYVVMSEGGKLLAFTQAVEGPDEWATKLCTILLPVLRAEPAPDSRGACHAWLASIGHQDAVITAKTNGVLRAILPSHAFGQSIPLHQLGSMRTRAAAIWQVWCADEATRRQAAARRVKQIAAKTSDVARLRQLCADVGRQLELPRFQVEDALSEAS